MMLAKNSSIEYKFFTYALRNFWFIFREKQADNNIFDIVKKTNKCDYRSFKFELSKYAHHTLL